MATSVEELSVANDTLRSQITDLRETVACLDIENQELLKENRNLKNKNKCLQETADEFKNMMEELQKNVDAVRESVATSHGKIHHLEVQNSSLAKVNEELNKELREVSEQVAHFTNYKVAQERDLLDMQNLSTEVKKYLKHLEERLDETQQSYQVQKGHSAQLRDKVALLLQLRESQRQDIKDLQGQLEMSVQQAMFLRLDQENRVQVGSLMHEVVEAKLVDVAKNKSTKRKVLHWFWKLGKLVLLLVAVCGLLVGMALTYTHYVNHKFISDTILVFFSEQNIEKIVHLLSHYLTWRNNGLLPF